MKLRVLVLPLLLYLLYASVMLAKQEQILFPASGTHHRPPAVASSPRGRLVGIPASFGTVRAFYQRAAGSIEPTPAVVYAHGNFECIEDSFSLVQPLTSAGIGVMQVEFPGFCGADGDPSFANIVEAEDLAYDWLAAQPEVDRARIVAMGYSIGGGAAGELTRNRPTRALILLSTFTSIADIAHRYALPAFLVRYPFDNVARVREFAGPVFLEHGRRDRVIPFAMGQKLAKRKAGSEFVALDCGHDDCDFDRTLFADRIPAWLVKEGVLTNANR